MFLFYFYIQFVTMFILNLFIRLEYGKYLQGLLDPSFFFLNNKLYVIFLFPSIQPLLLSYGHFVTGKSNINLD